MRVTELCPSPHLEPLDIGDKIGDEKILTMKRVEVTSFSGSRKATS